MKRFAQLFVNSTGYIPGTCPPQYDEKLIRPIERLGSDGVIPLDARHSLTKSVEITKEIARKRGKFITGFQIMKVKDPNRPFTSAEPLTQYFTL